MAVAQMTNRAEVQRDNAVIVQIVSAIPGGRTLDLSALAEGTIVRAGTVIVRNTESGEYSPLKITEGNYAEVGLGNEVAGILIYDVNKNDSQASILTAGQVNCGLAPAMPTEEMKKALPRIDFLFYKGA